METDKTQDLQALLSARIGQAQDDATQKRAFSAAFEEPDSIDWRYWVEQMPMLSAAHAARLMSALDPDVHRSPDASPSKSEVNSLRFKAMKIERLAAAHGREKDSPAGWLLWARGLGLKAHDGFVLAVELLERRPRIDGNFKAAASTVVDADVSSEAPTPSGAATPALTVPAAVAAAPRTRISQAAKKEAREDARLAHCEAEGLVFDKDPLRPLPYGIAKAAERLVPPITRQSLSIEVKAALRRRFERERNGKG